jgi:serine/threonine-protein kinase PknG
MNDRTGAANALRQIPARSSSYQAAQAALCSLLTEGTEEGVPTPDDLAGAAAALDQISGDARLRAALTRDILSAGLLLVERNPGAASGGEVIGVPLEEKSVRLALEKVCRTLAKLSPTDGERFALVDQANSFRPWTML